MGKGKKLKNERKVHSHNPIMGTSVDDVVDDIDTTLNDFDAFIDHIIVSGDEKNLDKLARFMTSRNEKIQSADCCLSSQTALAREMKEIKKKGEKSDLLEICSRAKCASRIVEASGYAMSWDCVWHIRDKDNEVDLVKVTYGFDGNKDGQGDYTWECLSDSDVCAGAYEGIKVTKPEVSNAIGAKSIDVASKFMTILLHSSMGFTSFD